MAEAQLPGMEDPPDERTVRELVDRFGFKEEKVLTWGRSRAEVTVQTKRKEEAIAVRKAAEAAGEEVPSHAAKRPVSGAEKLTAAEYLERALASDTDSQYLAVSYGVFDLDEAEVRKLAGWLAKRFRGEA